MANDIYQSASASKKDINYTGKDFNSFKKNLVEYAKSYFSSTYRFESTLSSLKFI